MMNGFFKKLFAGNENEQEKRIRAEMTYREQERVFRRYDTDLDKSIAKFEKMAVDAVNSGQKGNALCAARFVKKMTDIKEKVASVRQHFEMLHALSTVSDIMVQFMDNCNSLGCNLRERIDIKSLTESQYGMETGLNKLSFVTECVEQAFEQIENGLDVGTLSNPVDDEESEEMLKKIMNKHDIYSSESIGLDLSGIHADYSPMKTENEEKSEKERPEKNESVITSERMRRLKAI